MSYIGNMPRNLEVVLGGIFAKSELNNWQIYEENGKITVKMRFCVKDEDSDCENSRTVKYVKAAPSRVKRDNTRSEKYTRKLRSHKDKKEEPRYDSSNVDIKCDTSMHECHLSVSEVDAIDSIGLESDSDPLLDQGGLDLSDIDCVAVNSTPQGVSTDSAEQPRIEMEDNITCDGCGTVLDRACHRCTDCDQWKCCSKCYINDIHRNSAHPDSHVVRQCLLPRQDETRTRCCVCGFSISDDEKTYVCQSCPHFAMCDRCVLQGKYHRAEGHKILDVT